MQNHQNFDLSGASASAGLDADFGNFSGNEHVLSSFDTFVSPNDLVYNSFDTFNNTPSLLDDTSPYLDDNLEVSPAFESFNFGANNDYSPLFPAEESSTLPVSKKRKHQDIELGPESMTSSMESLAQYAPPASAPMSRIASTQSDRGMLRQRLSTSDGIPKSTHRPTKPLAPIEVDSGDEVAAKRAKNTMAARKSRQKKKDEVALLEDKLMKQTEETEYWKMLAIKHGAPIPTPSPSAMSPN